MIGRIFANIACDDDEAAPIAHHLVDANLAGHDSHGVLRTLRYRESYPGG